MIIPINDQYRLYGETYQWQIQSPRTRQGETVWESCGAYFTRLDQAANYIGNRMVREADTQTLSEALVEVERVVSLIKNAISKHFTVSIKIDE